MQNNPAPALLRFIFSSLLLGMMAAYGVSLLSVDVPIDLQARYLPPGASHWFGTDNMGRDLWLRCFQGALTSLQIGVGAAICSGVIAMLIASLTLIHPVMDQALRLIIDTLLSLPHLLLLILICFTVGGGMRGVVLAVAFTHWPKLALILRAEAQQIRTSDYMTL
ncbi:ABC transporter permease subunit, partial [Klebsiella quasipneumoniae]